MLEDMSVVDLIGWLATATGITAATIVSLNLGRRITGFGFIVFTVSSVSWVVAAVMDETFSLMVQNIVPTVINVIGIYRWLIAKTADERIAEMGEGRAA